MDSVDMVWRAQPALVLTGSVAAGDGPVSDVLVRALPAYRSLSRVGQWMEAGRTTTDSSGRFNMAGLAPGDYEVIAVRPPEAPEAAGRGKLAWATTTVTVANGTEPKSFLHLRPGPRVGGRVMVAGEPDASKRLMQNLSINFQYIDEPFTTIVNPSIRVSAAGHFESGVLMPGRYLVQTDVPPGWTVSSILIDGLEKDGVPFDVSIDVANVEVRLSSSVSRVEVQVETPELDGGTIAVFLVAADRSRWPNARTDYRRFRKLPALRRRLVFDDVPAGKYFVFAKLGSKTSSDWKDFRSLESIVLGAVAVDIERGSAPVVSLTVSKTP